MARIAIRLFNYIPDQCLVLTGEEWLRPLPHLGDWQHIRLGMLVAIQPNSTGPVIDGMLSLGLSSGRFNSVSSMRADNCIGACWTGAIAAGSTRNWTYNAGAGYPYFTPANTPQFFRRYYNPASGNTYVANNFNTSSYVIPAAGVGIKKRRALLVLDIQRAPSTGVYSLTAYWHTSTTQDWKPDQMMEAVDQVGTPNLGPYTFTATSTSTFNASEVTGALDTFSIYWSQLTYGLEVYAACASLIADNSQPQSSYPFAGGGQDQFTPAGTGDATGLNTGRGWAGVALFQGTNNPDAQVGMAGSSAGMDDPFEQYATGTALSGALNAGTNWSGAFTIAGTYPNLDFIPNQQTFYGTRAGMDDPFEQYATGTVLTNVLNAGTHWNGAWSVGGTYPGLNPLLDQQEFYGTATGADETFEAYSAGSIGYMGSGSNWSNGFFAVHYAGTTYSNGAAQLDMAGTSSGMPLDTFESYGTGTVTSPLSGGSYWASYGTIYSY